MTISLDLDLQNASSDNQLPEEDDVCLWVHTTLMAANYRSDIEPVELSIRLVDEAESQQLNSTYRNQNKATNVLSFPFDGPKQIPLALLGDLVICAPVVKLEANQQHKTEQSHWAHMVTHGVLHLIGYDHIEPEQAKQMEALEVQILNSLVYADPYVTNNFS